MGRTDAVGTGWPARPVVAAGNDRTCRVRGRAGARTPRSTRREQHVACPLCTATLCTRLARPLRLPMQRTAARHWRDRSPTRQPELERFEARSRAGVAVACIRPRAAMRTRSTCSDWHELERGLASPWHRRDGVRLSRRRCRASCSRPRPHRWPIAASPGNGPAWPTAWPTRIPASRSRARAAFTSAKPSGSSGRATRSTPSGVASRTCRGSWSICSR